MTTNNKPRPEYPRPDFRRESFQNLNGEWAFAFDDADVGLDEKWYERFDLDRTITVRAADDGLNLELPRGKQYWKPESEGIFYTSSTGIWQTVWIEQVAGDHLKKVWITPDVDRKTIAVRMEFAGSGDKRVRVRLSLKGRELVDDTVRVHKNRASRAFRLDQSISLDWNHQETMVWTPENPVLFDLDFEVSVQGRVTDHVTSYCALRKVSVVNGKFIDFGGEQAVNCLFLYRGYEDTATQAALRVTFSDGSVINNVSFSGDGAVLKFDFEADEGLTITGGSLSEDSERGKVLTLNGGAKHSSSAGIDTDILSKTDWSDGMTIAFWVKAVNWNCMWWDDIGSFAGSFDQLRVYNKALSAEEVGSVMNTGAIK